MSDGSINMGVWQGLLKWTLAQNDGTNPNSTQVTPMSEEDKQFLSKVMDSLVVDEVKRMKLIKTIITMPHQPQQLSNLVKQSQLDLSALVSFELEKGAKVESPEKQTQKQTLLKHLEQANVEELSKEVWEQKLNALEELDDRVGRIDNANDFIVVGGMEPLLAIISQPQDDELKMGALQALSTIIQNNPQAQDIMINKHHIMQLLLPFLPPPQKSEEKDNYKLPHWGVAAKVLGVIAPLVREHPVARVQLYQAQGLGSVIHLLKLAHHSKPVMRKCLFLLSWLFQHDPKCREDAYRHDIIPILISHIGDQDDIDVREQACAALTAFCENHPKHLQSLCHADLGLEQLLRARRSTLASLTNSEDREFHSTELESIDRLMRMCQFKI